MVLELVMLQLMARELDEISVFEQPVHYQQRSRRDKAMMMPSSPTSTRSNQTTGIDTRIYTSTQCKVRTNQAHHHHRSNSHSLEEITIRHEPLAYSIESALPPEP